MKNWFIILQYKRLHIYKTSFNFILLKYESSKWLMPTQGQLSLKYWLKIWVMASDRSKIYKKNYPVCR